MKLTLLTFYTPSVDNRRAPSALPYHLLLPEYRGDLQLEIFSFNYNRLSSAEIKICEQRLQTKIHLLDVPWWFRVMKRMPLSLIRSVLPRPHYSFFRLKEEQVKSIVESSPDAVVIYTEDLIALCGQLSEALPKDMPLCMLGPDCIAMYYDRLVRFSSMGIFRLRSLIMRYQYENLVKLLPPEMTYLYVGGDDCKYAAKIVPQGVSVKQQIHPHYQYLGHKIKFASPIRLLVTGRLNIYNREGVASLMAVLKQHCGKLSPLYELTFLGKDWGDIVKRLLRMGYQVRHITFAENYQSELIRHDIQLAPISQGSGTKGKVLDAMANGLLVIGTEYALENVYTKPLNIIDEAISAQDYGCVKYHTQEDLLKVLLDVPQRATMYEQIASRGRADVLKYHSRKTCTKQFLKYLHLL